MLLQMIANIPIEFSLWEHNGVLYVRGFMGTLKDM